LRAPNSEEARLQNQLLQKSQKAATETELPEPGRQAKKDRSNGLSPRKIGKEQPLANDRDFLDQPTSLLSARTVYASGKWATIVLFSALVSREWYYSGPSS
jgi:hypothetical protein